jgi:hypothetical protein
VLNRLCLLLAFVTIAALAIGCGGEPVAKRPKLAKTKGKVLYNGNPVEGATVAFHGEGAPRAATGTTDSAGRFELTTFDTGDGAVIGDHVVTVSKVVGMGSTKAGQDPTAMYGEYLKKKEAGVDPMKGALPEIYKDPKTSPQKNHVTAEGPNDFTIELKD